MKFEGARPLNSILAVIAWTPIVWRDVTLRPSHEFSRGVIWGQAGLSPRMPSTLPSRAIWNPTFENPRFWEEVRQLYFAFEREDMSAIRDFYEMYGALGYPGDDGEREPLPGIIGERRPRWAGQFPYLPEPWEWCSSVLNWFRLLTIIVNHCKQGRADVLREIWDRWESQYVCRDLLYGLPVQLHELPRPKMDEDLISFFWGMMMASVGMVLGQIPLRLVEPEMLPFLELSSAGPCSSPVFGFSPLGALEAAFLQWYFQELAPVGVRKCAREDCNNLVLSPRQKYCSARCRETEKKRRQRNSARGHKTRTSKRERGSANGKKAGK